MNSGICVRTDFCVYRGRNSYRAVHQRDRNTKYQIVVSSPGSETGHDMALQAWLARFTGPDTELAATYTVVARGSDWNGCYWILVPTEYH